MRGCPVSYATASKEIIHIRKQIGAEAYDQHALRYTAAAEIDAPGFGKLEQAMFTSALADRATYSRVDVDAPLIPAAAE